jgi:flagellar L-ring protein FlgH
VKWRVSGSAVRLLVAALVLFPVAGLLTSCAGSGGRQSQSPESGAVREKLEVDDLKAVEGCSKGSLWSDDSFFGDMFVTPKARRAGDVLTIKIVESSSASNTASTNTGRSSSISGSITNFLGLEKKYQADHPFLNPFGKVDASMANSFDGKGSTARAGDLTAYMSASVQEVLRNGTLRIMGTREVTVNNERQVMRLSGVVRPRDISSENVVLSTYIADAVIAYSGAGVLNDKQRPGWMARVLDHVWPF